MKPRGSDVRRLAATEFADQTAFWSPDNKQIIFTSDRDGKSEIYVMVADGKDVRRLTNALAIKRAPVWSPDSKKIAFSADGDAPSQISVMNADGSNLVCLPGL